MDNKLNIHICILIVHTYNLDCNTDVEIQKLCPGGKLPDDLKERMRKMEWTDFMQEVFDCLHKNEVSH